MRTVLFVFQTVGHDPTGTTFCGAGLRGRLTSNILQGSTRYKFIQCACDSADAVDESIRTHKPAAIIYNYHPFTTPWINNANFVGRYPAIYHVRVHYDLVQCEADAFLTSQHIGQYLVCDSEIIRGNDRVFIMPRSTPFPAKEPALLSDVPAIGFHGFLFERKGLLRVVEAVKAEFDTAILRIHSPAAHYCVENAEDLLARVRAILVGTNIQLEITQNFLSDSEMVEWLSKNTLNCYFYQEVPGSGLASAPDYAIAARRPIAVIRTNMLANIWNAVPSSIYPENTLKQIIDAGIAPFEPLYTRYSHDNVREAYERMCDRIVLPNVLYVGQANGFRKGEPNFCGIGLRGKLTTEILADSDRYRFIPCFCNSFEEVDAYVRRYDPVVIIFNYHPGTCAWPANNPSGRYPTIPTVLINVDMTQAMLDEFTRNPAESDYMLCDDETRIPSSRVFVMPRSTPTPVSSPPPDPEIPTIGFQGFPAAHKGIHELAHRVRDEFDTAIIRLHMPSSVYGDPDGRNARRWADEVRSIVAGTNIQVQASHAFMGDAEIVDWLSQNSVNCYFYNNDWPNAGPASSPDYALAARRPIAVRNTVMMTNITRHTPLATIEGSSLKEIISRGIDHLRPIYDHHSREAVLKAYEDMCDRIAVAKTPRAPPPPVHVPAPVPVPTLSWLRRK